MQIIEVSVVGVRSAVITLKQRDTPMQFVLFPMIHLGTPGFYQAVMSRLGSCQLLVSEGIRGKSTTGSLLTLSYRLLRRNRKLAELGAVLDRKEQLRVLVLAGTQRAPVFLLSHGGCCLIHVGLRCAERSGGSRR